MFPGKAILQIGNFGLYPYGLCLALGLVGCFLFLYTTFVKYNFDEKSIDAILIVGFGATIFGIFMAAVVQGLYGVFNGEPFSLQGMTFQGGLIGGVGSFLIVWNTYMYVISPRTKIKALKSDGNAGLCDALPIIPIGITIAHAFGRLGCFFAGCCYGKKTNAWFGIPCADDYGGLQGMYNYTLGKYVTTKVIPTQLFECLFLVALSVLMYWLLTKRNFKCNFGLYAIAYGIWRFLCEMFLRADASRLVGTIPPSAVISIVMVVFGIGYFFAYKYWFVKCMRHPELQEPLYKKKSSHTAEQA